MHRMINLTTLVSVCILLLLSYTTAAPSWINPQAEEAELKFLASDSIQNEGLLNVNYRGKRSPESDGRAAEKYLMDKSELVFVITHKMAVYQTIGDYYTALTDFYFLTDPSSVKEIRKADRTELHGLAGNRYVVLMSAEKRYPQLSITKQDLDGVQRTRVVWYYSGEPAGKNNEN